MRLFPRPAGIRPSDCPKMRNTPMLRRTNNLFTLGMTAVLVAATIAPGASAGVFGKKKKYDNPISKDTLQPDKVLFDRAIKDVEHGRYEIARLTLNTLINTYDTSEFLAKAKLAIADSWYREGGTHGLAQAEAEYKDFILFYPNMEESAESQMKICGIHFKQMEKADRDPAQAQRTEDECRDLMVKFPNSKFLPQATQMLRNAQEVLADKEFRTGAFYRNKGSFPAAANRLTYVSLQYPLYSGSDEALWQLADSYNRMGDRFENQAADAYTKLLRDYPLSKHADDATSRLEAMKRPVPKADAATVARMQREFDGRIKQGILSRSMGLVTGKPDVHLASREGDPSMKTMRPPVPVSVPLQAANTDAAAGTGAGGGISDVTAGTVTDTTALDRAAEARKGVVGGVATDPAAGAAAAAPVGGNISATTTATAPKPEAPLPTNHSLPVKEQRRQMAKAEAQAKAMIKKAQKAQKNAPAAKPDAAAPDASKPDSDKKTDPAAKPEAAK